ncbi:hypothetical protein DFH08DRAFT_843670 [Mycena albidolilacea]|uniref:Secreted protein n=1 Tax=Mycena albidolilacea TaxID=1033008 RepID=A0AAD7F1V0_9AGAR|nr:hypothetical protein DFH08DRAFT_843670 [Mycena albidolilacea]
MLFLQGRVLSLPLLLALTESSQLSIESIAFSLQVMYSSARPDPDTVHKFNLYIHTYNTLLTSAPHRGLYHYYTPFTAYHTHQANGTLPNVRTNPAHPS